METAYILIFLSLSA